MLTKHLLAGLTALAVVGPPAFAQTSPAPAPGSAPSAADASRGSGQFLPMRQPDQFRASDFIGERVYGANDESIGEINDVLMDAKGQVAGVIIGVGGFLGIGEKDVALPMSALQFRDEPPATAATTGRDTATTGTTGTAGTTPPAGARHRGGAGRRRRAEPHRRVDDQGPAAAGAGLPGQPERGHRHDADEPAGLDHRPGQSERAPAIRPRPGPRRPPGRRRRGADPLSQATARSLEGLA